MPIDSQLPQADPFSLVPTFKPINYISTPLEVGHEVDTAVKARRFVNKSENEYVR
jgi:hypothetical protein